MHVKRSNCVYFRKNKYIKYMDVWLVVLLRDEARAVIVNRAVTPLELAADAYHTNLP